MCTTVDQQQSQISQLFSHGFLSASDQLKWWNFIADPSQLQLHALCENSENPVLSSCTMCWRFERQWQMAQHEHHISPFTAAIFVFSLNIFFLCFGNSWLFSHLQRTQYAICPAWAFSCVHAHTQLYTYAEPSCRHSQNESGPALVTAPFSVLFFVMEMAKYRQSRHATVPPGHWTMMTDEYLQGTIKVLFHHHKLNFEEANPPPPAHTHTHTFFHAGALNYHVRGIQMWEWALYITCWFLCKYLWWVK